MPENAHFALLRDWISHPESVCPSSWPYICVAVTVERCVGQKTRTRKCLEQKERLGDRKLDWGSQKSQPTSLEKYGAANILDLHFFEFCCYCLQCQA